MQRGVRDVLADIDRVGIPAYLPPRLFCRFLRLAVGRAALQILEFDDVRVLHVREHLVSRPQEDVGISRLVVEFGDGAVEMALAGEGESVSVNERLAFLPVSLRRVAVDAVVDVLEEGLEVAVVCHALLELRETVGVSFEVVVVIVVEKVGIYLLAYHLVRYYEA